MKANLRYLRPSQRPAKQRGFLPVGLLAGGAMKLLPYLAVLLIVLGGWLYYKHLVNTIERQKTEIVQLEARVKELETQLSDCHQANEKYQAAIQEINATVDRLITVSEQQQRTMAILKGQITKERADKQKLVGELEDLKSRPLAETCEAAIEELVNAPKDFTSLTPTESPQ